MDKNTCQYKLKNNGNCNYKAVSTKISLCGLHILSEITGNSKNTKWVINEGIYLNNDNILVDNEENNIMKGKKYVFAFPLDKKLEKEIYLIMYTIEEDDEDDKDDSIDICLANKKIGYPRKFIKLNNETEALIELKNNRSNSKFIECLNKVKEVYKNSRDIK